MRHSLLICQLFSRDTLVKRTSKQRSRTPLVEGDE